MSRPTDVLVGLEIVEGVDHVCVAWDEDGLVECVEIVVGARAD